MKIITTPDARLREKSEKVGKITPEVLDIIAEMRRLSLEWEKANAGFTALIDPVVIKAEGKTKRDYEGCLSVPSIYGMVPRASKVRVKAKLEDGTEVRIKATDELARTLLHEIDHLDGILFIDHIKGEKDAFYEMNDKGDLVPGDYDSRIAGNKKLWGEE